MVKLRREAVDRSLMHLHRVYGLSVSTVWQIVHGVTWQDAGGPIRPTAPVTAFISCVEPFVVARRKREPEPTYYTVEPPDDSYQEYRLGPAGYVLIPKQRVLLCA